MNSRVRYLDESTGQRNEIEIVYPSHADPSAGRISVLAPVGSALIGLSVGQQIDWDFPNGRSIRLRVEVCWRSRNPWRLPDLGDRSQPSGRASVDSTGSGPLYRRRCRSA